MDLQSIKWWKSDTLRAGIAVLAASLVGLIVALGAVFGITIDPIMQGKLIAVFMALFMFATSCGAVWQILARLNVTTVIEGSKGEKAVIAATGVTPQPKSEPVKPSMN